MVKKHFPLTENAARGKKFFHERKENHLFIRSPSLYAEGVSFPCDLNALVIEACEEKPHWSAMLSSFSSGF